MATDNKNEGQPEVFPLRLKSRRNQGLKPELLEAVGKSFAEEFPEASAKTATAGQITRIDDEHKPKGQRRRFRKPGQAEGSETQRLDHAMGVRMTLQERQALTILAERSGYTSTASFARKLIVTALSEAGLLNGPAEPKP